MSGSRLTVVGAGPAGLAACIEAARAGLECTLFDEAPAPGGQIYRPPPAGFRVESGARYGRDAERGRALLDEFRAHSDKVDLRPRTAVLGLWPDRRLLWAQDDRSGIVTAERTVVATGAYDRPVPFPGWTLPGVMTAGAAQIFVKAMGVRPGRRALVAGTGPLLLVVANQLHHAGVQVVEVLEAGRPGWNPLDLWRVRGAGGLLRDAWRYWRDLRRAGIPYRFGHTVFAALGEGRVQRARYGPVDAADWSPRLDRAREVEVDLVVSGFGFVPSTELTTLAGCAHRYVEALGGWVPERDPCMRTTAPGLYAAGDGAGVAGVLVAVDEGRVAGITAAQDAGRLDAAEAHRRRAAPLARLKRMARVRRVLDRISAPRPGLGKLANEDTLVCRCEEVDRRALDAAAEQGAGDLQAVKLLTRLGMGPCQGRQCAPAAAALLAQRTGREVALCGRVNPRPPCQPVSLGSLALGEATQGESPQGEAARGRVTQGEAFAGTSGHGNRHGPTTESPS